MVKQPLEKVHIQLNESTLYLNELLRSTKNNIRSAGSHTNEQNINVVTEKTPKATTLKPKSFLVTWFKTAVKKKNILGTVRFELTSV